MSEVLSARNDDEFEVTFDPGYFCEVCEDKNIKVKFTTLRDLLAHDMQYHPDEESG